MSVQSTIFLLLVALAFYSLTALLIYALVQKVNKRCSKLGINNSPFPLKGFAVYHFQIFSGCLKLLYWRLKPRPKLFSHISPQTDRKHHVLCVHGFRMNGSCFDGLRLVLQQNGYHSSAVDLGAPYIKVELYVQALEQHFKAVLTTTEAEHITVVAHSMGGLIVRMLLQKRPELADRLTQVITLGSPHQGTAAVKSQQDTWISDLFHPQSQRILNLPSFTHMAPQLPVVSIASEHDLIVFPAHYSHLPGTRAETLSGISHTGLLTHDAIHQKLLHYLKKHLGSESELPPDTSSDLK